MSTSHPKQSTNSNPILILKLSEYHPDVFIDNSRIKDHQTQLILFVLLNSHGRHVLTWSRSSSGPCYKYRSLELTLKMQYGIQIAYITCVIKSE